MVRYVQADRDNEQDEYYRKQREERERLDRIKKEFQERKAKDLAEFSVMLEKAERWHKAENLRKYIDKIESKGFSSADWIAWARKKADWYDPFEGREDEVLGRYEETGK